MAHGLANAIILPYSMDFNQKDSFVKEKYTRLSKAIGKDVTEAVRELQKTLHIPKSFAEAGIEEDDYIEQYETLCTFSMKGATAVNPVRVSEEEMRKFVHCVYYGTKVDF